MHNGDRQRSYILERHCTTYGPEIRITNPLYGDDIAGIGNPMVIKTQLKAIRRKKKVYFQQHKKHNIKNCKQR